MRIKMTYGGQYNKSRTARWACSGRPMRKIHCVCVCMCVCVSNLAKRAEERAIQMRSPALNTMSSAAFHSKRMKISVPLEHRRN